MKKGILGLGNQAEEKKNNRDIEVLSSRPDKGGQLGLVLK